MYNRCAILCECAYICKSSCPTCSSKKFVMVNNFKNDLKNPNKSKYMKTGD